MIQNRLVASLLEEEMSASHMHKPKSPLASQLPQACGSKESPLRFDASKRVSFEVLTHARFAPQLGYRSNSPTRF